MKSDLRIEEITALWYKVPALRPSEPTLGIKTVRERFEADEDARVHHAELLALTDLPDEFERLSDEDVETGNSMCMRAESALAREDAYFDLIGQLLDIGSGPTCTRAILLVARLAPTDRGSVANGLVRELLRRGMYTRVREAILVCQPDDAVMLTLELHATVNDAAVLRLARVLTTLADRPESDSSDDGLSRRCLYAKHMAALWRASGDDADLAAARERCGLLPFCDRVTAWIHVAQQTWQPRDFMAAFQAAAMEPDPEIRAESASRAIRGVIRAVMPVYAVPRGDMLVAEVASLLTDQRWRGELLRRAAELKPGRGRRESLS